MRPGLVTKLIALAVALLAGCWLGQEVEPGSQIPFHAHSAPEAEEVLICLRGEGEILVGDDDARPFLVGEPWHVAKGVPHSIINLSTTDSLWLTWTISPAMSVASLTQDSRSHGAQALVAKQRTVSLKDWEKKGFAVVESVFEPGEMESLGALVSSLAEKEVARIEREASAGTIQLAGLDGVSTAEEYVAYQRANPTTWVSTVSAMSTVQMQEDGRLIPRKLNHPIKNYALTPGTPNGGAFRSIAMDPRLTSLASQLLGGRAAMVFSDQVFMVRSWRCCCGCF